MKLSKLTKFTKLSARWRYTHELIELLGRSEDRGAGALSGGQPSSVVLRHPRYGPERAGGAVRRALAMARSSKRLRDGAITQCCIVPKAACMLHLRSTHCRRPDALRRTAFLGRFLPKLRRRQKLRRFFRHRIDPPPGQVQIISSGPLSGRRRIWSEMFEFASGQGRRRLPISQSSVGRVSSGLAALPLAVASSVLTPPSRLGDDSGR
jgi:hypothetical protein